MSRFLAAFLLVGLFSGVFPQTAHATPLCFPGPYRIDSDCLPYGSWGYFARLAELGITVPLQPLPVSLVDPALSELDISYAIVNTMEGDQVLQRPIFATMADAVAYTNPSAYMKPGSSSHYLTYTSVQQVDGTNYYLTGLGWMRRSDLSPVEVRRFGMGVQLHSPPERPFGWVLEYAAGETAPFQARTAPSLQATRSGTFAAYSVLEVFDIQDSGDLSWYLVGPDLWLNSLQMRLVVPATQPPEGVDNGRWIEINLEQQSISAYEDNQLVFATLVATGLDNLWTRPGLFQIYEKNETTPMSGDFSGGAGGYYYLADVPWTMYYDQARA
ncbi:MAG TPA: L,D-transpeptidase, partial [Anaerolineales bacterium]